MSNFPPRAGPTFFLLWVAGICIMGIIARTLPPIDNFQLQQVLWMAAAILGAAWSGFLVFSRWQRILAWALLPVAFLPVADSVGVPHQILMIAAQCLLLVSVRRRPWIWLIVSILNFAFLTTLSFWFVRFQFDASNHLASLLPFISPARIRGALVFGVFTIGDVLAGAALAWFMPPKHNNLTQAPPGN